MAPLRKTGHYVVTGEIELISGTRIGGSDDVLQIGGTDLTCIRDPASGKPYIPGSSLKGRMRAELERELGKITGNEPCGCAQRDCPVCRVFGPHKNTRHELGPTRIIVRDAFLTEGGQIELKTESTNKRMTGGAEHPRTLERVVPGSKFAFEVAVQVFDIDRDFEYTDPDGKPVHDADGILNVVYHGIDLLEQAGIGAGVGKGYGKIRIKLNDLTKPPTRTRRPVIPPN